MNAVILLANANTEVNLRRRERLKPELHPSYRQSFQPHNFSVIRGRPAKSCQRHRRR